MKAIDLIQNDVPPIKIDESLEKALNWMDEFKVNHLPVVSGSEFVGLISYCPWFEFGLITTTLRSSTNSFNVRAPLYKQLMSLKQIYNQ